MQMAFYFDQARCIGCLACVIACKQWHQVPPGPVKWRRVITIESGTYPETKAHFLSAACYHCAFPACAAVCPGEAITKRKEDGVVVVNQDNCLGKKCRLCLDACPYGAPQFGDDEKAVMQKCDFCADRLAEGKKPICVAACITGALDAGPIERLERKYGGGHEAIGFVNHEDLKPSVLYKTKLTAGVR